MLDPAAELIAGAMVQEAEMAVALVAAQRVGRDVAGQDVALQAEDGDAAAAAAMAQLVGVRSSWMRRARTSRRWDGLGGRFT